MVRHDVHAGLRETNSLPRFDVMSTHDQAADRPAASVEAAGLEVLSATSPVNRRFCAMHSASFAPGRTRRPFVVARVTMKSPFHKVATPGVAEGGKAAQARHTAAETKAADPSTERVGFDLRPIRN